MSLARKGQRLFLFATDLIAVGDHGKVAVMSRRKDRQSGEGCFLVVLAIILFPLAPAIGVLAYFRPFRRSWKAYSGRVSDFWLGWESQEEFSRLHTEVHKLSEQIDEDNTFADSLGLRRNKDGSLDRRNKRAKHLQNRIDNNQRRLRGSSRRLYNLSILPQKRWSLLRRQFSMFYSCLFATIGWIIAIAYSLLFSYSRPDEGENIDMFFQSGLVSLSVFVCIFLISWCLAGLKIPKPPRVTINNYNRFQRESEEGDLSLLEQTQNDGKDIFTVGLEPDSPPQPIKSLEDSAHELLDSVPSEEQPTRGIECPDCPKVYTALGLEGQPVKCGDCGSEFVAPIYDSEKLLKWASESSFSVILEGFNGGILRPFENDPDTRKGFYTIFYRRQSEAEKSRCPNPDCRSEWEISEEQRGHTVNCGKCGEKSAVPFLTPERLLKWAEEAPYEVLQSSMSVDQIGRGHSPGTITKLKEIAEKKRFREEYKVRRERNEPILSLREKKWAASERRLRQKSEMEELRKMDHSDFRTVVIEFLRQSGLETRLGYDEDFDLEVIDSNGERVAVAKCKARTTSRAISNQEILSIADSFPSFKVEKVYFFTNGKFSKNAYNEAGKLPWLSLYSGTDIVNSAMSKNG